MGFRPGCRSEGLIPLLQICDSGNGSQRRRKHRKHWLRLGLKGRRPAAAYCAVKGGIVNVTRAMAIDYGPMNIRVNASTPGDTDTAMLRDEGRQTGMVEKGDAKMDDYLKDCGTSRPLARIGMPEDIANGVLFLCSDLASWVTGAALVVDGGGIA